MSDDEKRLLHYEKTDLIENESIKSSENEEKNNFVHWTSWFKLTMFYQYGLVYMFVRLVCNVTSVILKILFKFYYIYISLYSIFISSMLLKSLMQIYKKKLLKN